MAVLPDPEMRRFLAAGTVDEVRSALSPHVIEGIVIVSSDETETVIRNYRNETVAFPTKQMLKHTVRAANTLLGVIS